MKRFGDRVDKMSNGRLKMEILPDGAVVNAFEILDAVDKGRGRRRLRLDPLLVGQEQRGGPCSPTRRRGAGTGMDQLSHMAWLSQGGGNALYEKLYEQGLKMNIKPFMMQPMGPDPFGWFKVPINSIADMKKMKYRSPPGLTGEIFKEMGITAVAMPGGEIVPAAQRGVIDAAEWIGPADDMILGFHNVFKHYYLQGLHQSSDVGEVLFNKTVWNKLPADLKAVIEGAVMATITETYAFNVDRNAKALEKLQKEHKVIVHDTPKEFFAAFHKATNLVYDREGGAQPTVQGSAGIAARLCQGRGALLDQDQRPVLRHRRRSGGRQVRSQQTGRCATGVAHRIPPAATVGHRTHDRTSLETAADRAQARSDRHLDRQAHGPG
jgi:TRAP-type mannitol/chloroaromatic compound transport system substrate-binding protein